VGLIRAVSPIRNARPCVVTDETVTRLRASASLPDRAADRRGVLRHVVAPHLVDIAVQRLHLLDLPSDVGPLFVLHGRHDSVRYALMR
jgi:hypothetical protein